MSDPITCIKKPEPAAHTPGPWGAYPDMARIRIESRDHPVAYVAIVDRFDAEAIANARLIAQAPALLAFAERTLPQMIAERDCYYEGCSVKSNGQVHDIEDQMTLDHYDRDIEQLRTLIAACKGDA